MYDTHTQDLPSRQYCFRNRSLGGREVNHKCRGWTLGSVYLLYLFSRQFRLRVYTSWLAAFTIRYRASHFSAHKQRPPYLVYLICFFRRRECVRWPVFVWRCLSVQITELLIVFFAAIKQRKRKKNSGPQIHHERAVPDAAGNKNKMDLYIS